jgi:hypothetical protein
MVEGKMPKFNVSFISRVWLAVEVIAPCREVAEAKAQRKIHKHMNDNGVIWLDGKNELCGTTNLSLLNKIPQ